MKTIYILLFTSLLISPQTSFCSLPKDASPIPAINTAIYKNKNSIKVALLLDTSNSMDGLINQAKSQLWDIVNELSYARCDEQAPRLEIALYEYGNDNLPSEEGYLRQVLGFSDDLDKISEKLFALRTNGGSEYCGTVIQSALNQLNWKSNPDDLKLIFIAGNEPFTQGEIHYLDATTNAKEKNVVVNTIFCGNFRDGVRGKWQDGALQTGGDYMSIDMNREIIAVHTPYDDDILRLNASLNNTYVPYGNRGYAGASNQMAQDSNAAELEEAVIVKRAVSKSSHFYKNSEWDLVDATEAADFEYKKLEAKDLPVELQNKTSAEIQKLIESKRKSRTQIKAQIQELNKKRTSWINTRKNDRNEAALEGVMIKALKKQAAKKNFTWQ